MSRYAVIEERPSKPKPIGNRAFHGPEPLKEVFSGVPRAGETADRGSIGASWILERFRSDTRAAERVSEPYSHLLLAIRREAEKMAAGGAGLELVLARIVEMAEQRPFRTNTMFQDGNSRRKACVEIGPQVLALDAAITLDIQDPYARIGNAYLAMGNRKRADEFYAASSA